MMKIDRFTFLFLLDGIVALFALLFGTSMNVRMAAAIAAVTIVLILISIYTIYDHRLSLSSVLLLYTIATQFGLVIPYTIFGREVLSNYHDYTLRFLRSSMLVKAILLGNFAIICFETAKRMTAVKRVKRPEKNRPADGGMNQKMFRASAAGFLIVLLYFAYHVLFGSTRLVSTYEGFMRSSAYTSGIYAYILIVFYASSIYLAASGTIRERKTGWFLWLLIVLIFAFNGNKGEFLYALLAVIGLQGSLGKKIDVKLILLSAFLLFFVIPSITLLRSVGIAGNLGSAKWDFVSVFTEMGMQIRTSVYVLEGLDHKTISPLWGMSYIQPVINMIVPFSHKIATSDIRKMFPGYGFNQVIESYLNLGVAGVAGYFGLVGYVISKAENELKSRIDLAYLGTVTCVLINASRNYFAFVPGQTLIVTVIYYLIKKTRVGGRNEV